jgi:putative hemolysin
MDATLLFILLGLPVLVVASAFCSSSETALFSLTYHDRVRLTREYPLAASAVAYLLARPRPLLVTLIFLNTLVNTLYFVLTALLVGEVHGVWAKAGLSVLNVALLTVLAEVVVKMLAAEYRVAFAGVLAVPVEVVFRAIGPVRTFLDRGVIAPLARLIAPPEHSGDAAHALTPDELTELVALGQREGAIDADEQAMLRHVIHFGELRVRDVMTPRTDLTWIDVAAPTQRVLEIWRRTGLTRIPVARGSLDHGLLGLLNVKTYVLALARGASPRVEQHLEPPRYFPETTTLDRLLTHFRDAGTKIGVCVDEHGEIVGVISVRDLVQRLITELASEAGDASEPRPEQVGPGRWIVPGRFSVREWPEIFGLRTDPRVSTLAGLVVARLGRLPKVGDSVRIGNVRLEVLSVAGRVADRVLVGLEEDSAPGVAASPGAGRAS